MHDEQRPVLTTHQKALKINLDAARYGTFAEIGAGQEVAHWFFKVGAAAGSIAKSISAYDMAVSDAIYGRCKRYVSRERLHSMLDYEHSLNLERLRPLRGDTTAFFAFADTVSARNFQGSNECHGWMGVKFQAQVRDADSQIIIHVRMLDHDNGSQQQALGIVGRFMIKSGIDCHVPLHYGFHIFLRHPVVHSLEQFLVTVEGGMDRVDRIVERSIGAGEVMPPSRSLLDKPFNTGLQTDALDGDGEHFVGAIW